MSITRVLQPLCAGVQSNHSASSEYKYTPLMHLPGKKKGSEGNQAYKATEWHWHKNTCESNQQNKT